MLLSFSVENFYSYRERQSLSLLAEDRENLIENTTPITAPALRGHRVVKFAGIYGANASGKSNFLLALNRLTEIIANSARESTAADQLPITPFQLDDAWAARPTQFAATFVIDNVVYVYDVSLTKDRIHSEELTAFSKSHPQRLFSRRVDSNGKSQWHFSRTHFRRDKALEGRTRRNSLYLSVGALFNHPQLAMISEYFSRCSFRSPQLVGTDFIKLMSRCDSDVKFIRWAAEMLSVAHTGIAALRLRPVDTHGGQGGNVQSVLPESAGAQFRRIKELQVAHLKSDGQTVWWPIGWESEGTRQLLSLLRSWYDMLNTGGLVLVDEMESSLHPLLCRRLLTVFAETRSSEHHGQLLFTTHNAALLDLSILRRDQVILAEKSGDGATQLISLLHYTPRAGEALQKGYLSGRYGAVPLLTEFKLHGQKPSKGNSEKITISSASN
jgi:AAA15 family ATPase/GTPase